MISRHLHEAHGVEPSTKSSAATKRLADAHDTGAPKLNDMQVKKQASKRFGTTVPPAAIPETASEPVSHQPAVKSAVLLARLTSPFLFLLAANCPVGLLRVKGHV